MLYIERQASTTRHSRWLEHGLEMRIQAIALLVSRVKEICEDTSDNFLVLELQLMLLISSLPKRPRRSHSRKYPPLCFHGSRIWFQKSPTSSPPQIPSTVTSFHDSHTDPKGLYKLTISSKIPVATNYYPVTDKLT